MEKLRVGVVGATGYVGQRFICLLAEHPWFDLQGLAASGRSAGKSYAEAVEGRWKLTEEIPEKVKNMEVLDASDVDKFVKDLDFVFCAVDMPKADIVALEEAIAKTETAVISNNSANRWTKDVPMIIPEINADHSKLIEAQRHRLGTKRGFIACKPNCSIQSYVPALTPLMKYGLEKVLVSTYQAISGAGKTFKDWPEMLGNLIPYIGGEEQKSEEEPLRIWGEVKDGEVMKAEKPLISAQCYRVAVQEGHTASVAVAFKDKPSKAQILDDWATYKTIAQELALPSAPEPFLVYFEEENRPQAALDANVGQGMAVAIGRLREDNIFDYKFTCLSHNTLRGAAGGGVLMAELLYKQGYLGKKSV